MVRKCYGWKMLWLEKNMKAKDISDTGKKVQCVS